LPTLTTPEEKIAFLQGAAAQSDLARLAGLTLREEETLPLLTDLRRTFSPDEAALLLQQARLRKRAASKFPQAAQMYFVEEALEQATTSAIAIMRAQLLDEYAEDGDWLDLGCGIGGDLLALAHFRNVVGYEVEPLRAAFARTNVAAADLPHSAEVRETDWVAALESGNLPTVSAAFVDPARRIQGATNSRKRVFSLYQMEPSIDIVRRLSARVPLVAVKVAPGVQNEEIPDGCNVQFVSHEGVCKEAVLWFGLPTKRRWASVHDGVHWHTLDAAGEPPPQGDLAAGMFLYEPDPAVIRSGALAELCAPLQAWQFDPQIAYLVAITETQDRNAAPFVTRFAIREVHNFSLRLLNQRIVALGIGSVELKKRGFPVEPESLRAKLKIVRGGAAATIVFTRRGDEHIMLICQRV